jgi:hypothetical protein
MPITQNNLLEIVLRGIPNQLDLPDWDDWELPELEPMPELNIDLPPLEDWDFPDLSGLNFQIDLDWDLSEPGERTEPEPEPKPKRIKPGFPLRIIQGGKG